MKPNCSFKTFFTICSVFLVLNCPAQVSYFQGTLKEAMSKAANESKFVLLQFEAAECEHCNDVANKGLEHKEVADKLEQAFISLKITPDHPDRIQIANAYHFIPQKSFGTIFLDNNGTLLHSFLKTTSFYKEYLKQIDIALTRAGEVLQIGQLEKEYKNGNKSFGFLEMLLEKRKVLHLETDSLLEEYVQTLPVDSLKTVRTLVFIAKMAPMLDSKADRVLRGDQPAFRLAWYSMPTTVRSSINGQVIFKGMQKAIKEKNEKLALRTAHFAQSINSNQVAGAKSYDMNMLRYYDEVKDTASYFRKAIAYYERYFVIVNPDSIKRMDSVNMDRIRQTAKKDTIREGNRLTLRTTVAYSPVVQRYCSELNNGAYKFYLLTSNPYLLSIATEWSKKALQFYESPEALDTYARLLYKQNQKEAAKGEMEKAIVLQKKRGLPTKSYDAVLEKMNKNAALTD